MKAKTPVIDVACGGRMFYFDKENPFVTFCDEREEIIELCDGRFHHVEPDVIADYTDLPFDSESFHLVVFDPPHLIEAGGKSWLVKKYGILPEDWENEIRKGFSECFRVLKPNGTLIFKWNETQIPVSKVLSLTSEKPLFGNRSGKQSKTHWICFFKGEK